MSNLIEIPSAEVTNPGTTTGLMVPVPRVPVSVRPATAGDLAFIDGLQKMHTHMVGWMPGKQIEEKIERGHVLIAEGQGERGERRGEEMRNELAPGPSPLPPVPVGYCISQDQYMKRDDVGIIFQLNVLPVRQRSLIGATLVKAALARAAYGCRLFGCWCAQDIRANFFWESIGFIPLAFRTGSRSKQRTHIYWQRRVREDDRGTGGTPYWFPFQTGSGAVREDRLVIPIPVGTHWRDVMPVLLPQAAAQGSGERGEGSAAGQAHSSLIARRSALATEEGKRQKDKGKSEDPISSARRVAIIRSQSKHLKGLPPGKAAVVTAGGIRYIERGDYVPAEPPPTAKPKRTSRQRAAKHDPKQLAAARELRDRYLEYVNTNAAVWTVGAKYDVSRAADRQKSAPDSDALPLNRLLNAA